MKKILAIAAFVFLLGGMRANAQSCGGFVAPQGVCAPNLTAPIAITFPTGALVWVTNGNAAGDCTTGGGSTATLCIYNGSAWVGAGTVGGGGLIAPWSQSTVTITGAATAVLDMSAAAGLKPPESAGLTPTATQRLVIDSTLGRLRHWDATGTPAARTVVDTADISAAAVGAGVLRQAASVGGAPPVVTSAELSGDVTTSTSNVTTLKTAARQRGFGGQFGATDTGAAVLVTGMVRYITVPYACTINGYDILISPADTATFKTWKIATGAAIPTVANVISTSGVAISSGTALHSTTTSDFTTTTVTAFDIVAVTITAVGGVSTFASFQVGCII